VLASPNTTPAAHAAGTTAAAAAATIGPRKQLGRYPTPQHGDRVLLAQRVDGRVRVTDRPIARGQRSYVVARWVQSLAELTELLLHDAEVAERDRDLARPPRRHRIARATAGRRAAEPAWALVPVRSTTAFGCPCNRW